MKIKIDGKYWDYFNDFTLSDQLDTCAATFAFTFKYDPANPDHADISLPLGFQKVEVFDDEDNLFFTGTVLNHKFNSEAMPELVQVSGGSLGIILEDCTIPYAAYPLESTGRNLKEITQRLLAYFNLQLVIVNSVVNECNQPFVKSVAKPRGTIKEYLSKLAAQKNVVLSHGVFGEIIYFRPNLNAPSIGLFTKQNTLSMSFDINGQGMHSDITIIRQASKPNNNSVDFDKVGGSGAHDSVKNNLVKGFRPVVDMLTSGSGKDTLRGASNTLAAELKNIKLSFSLNRWEKIKPGDVLEIQNDEIRLPNPTRFIVESTVMSQNSKELSMGIICVLPETFTGGQPKNIFA